MSEHLPATVSQNTITHFHAANHVPALIAAAGDRAGIRFLELFASTIRNPHTRRAYGRAVGDFLTWYEDHAVASIAAVQPLHVAAWIELQTRAFRADREAAPGGYLSPVRLAGDGLGRASEPGRVRAWAIA